MTIVFICIGTILLLFFLVYLIRRFSHAKSIPFYSPGSKKDSILTIGIIGDSWVTRKKLDIILHDDLLKNGFHNKIISSGHSGAKSKSVYRNLFKDNTEPNSSKFIIDSQPEFCIVIAGVNDAVGQMGSRYYAHHMRNIIKTLLHYKIRPVVVYLPNVGIREMNNGLNVLKKYRNIISAYFNNNGIIDNIESYRRKLNETLHTEELGKQVIIIDFDSTCEGFSSESDLYYNPLHLSVKGNEKLAHVIADTLIKELAKNKTKAQ